MSLTSLIQEADLLNYVKKLLEPTNSVSHTIIENIFNELVESNNHLKVIEFILQQNTCIKIKSINNVYVNGYIDIVKLFLKYDRIVYVTSLDTSTIFTNNQIEIAKLLIENNKLDKSTAIMCASNYGHLEILNSILKDKNINLNNINLDYLLNSASEYGHTEVVRLLLQIDKVDPNTGDDRAINFASKNGHIEVVRLLLQDKRIVFIKNTSIIYALQYNHIEIAKLLLQNDKVDSNAKNSVFKYASTTGHTEIVQLLLQDPRVKVDDDNNYAIIKACEKFHIEIIKLLIPKIDINELINNKYYWLVSKLKTELELVNAPEQQAFDLINANINETELKKFLIEYCKNNNFTKLVIKNGEVIYTKKIS